MAAQEEAAAKPGAGVLSFLRQHAKSTLSASALTPQVPVWAQDHSRQRARGVGLPCPPALRGSGGPHHTHSPFLPLSTLSSRRSPAPIPLLCGHRQPLPPPASVPPHRPHRPCTSWPSLGASLTEAFRRQLRQEEIFHLAVLLSATIWGCCRIVAKKYFIKNESESLPLCYLTGSQAGVHRAQSTVPGAHV